MTVMPVQLNSRKQMPRAQDKRTKSCSNNKPFPTWNPPLRVGTIVTNPPYGVRTKEGNDLRDLYARFGSILLEKFKGWTVVMLSPDDVLTGNLGLGQPVDSLQFLNGGIPVKMLKYKFNLIPDSLRFNTSFL